jgi:hypothetical protein
LRRAPRADALPVQGWLRFVSHAAALEAGAVLTRLRHTLRRAATHRATQVDDAELSMTRAASDDAPFSALAFKIMTDPFVGSLTFCRIYRCACCGVLWCVVVCVVCVVCAVYCVCCAGARGALRSS